MNSQLRDDEGLPIIEIPELDARTKAVWQKKLVSDGLWDAFLEAKEQRRRQLRQLGYPRSEANLTAWWDVIETLDHKLEAKTMNDAEFWKYQYAWTSRLFFLTSTDPAAKPRNADCETIDRRPSV